MTPARAHPCRFRRRVRPQRRAPARGFTLLELLVVIVIAGMTIGMVSFTILQHGSRAIQKEAQRIALLLQLGRDEAIVRNRPVAFEADRERYRFVVRENNRWQILSDDDLLRSRVFEQSPMQLSIAPLQAGAAPGEADVLRIVFGREPVGKPFLLTLAAGTAQASIRADGIGHFSVEGVQ